MRIVHAPINSAGQATAISRAQRKLGHTSDVIVLYETNFDYISDLNLHTERLPKYIREFVVFCYFLSFLSRYDVFHFHCGITFLPRNFDLYWLKLFGKKIIMEYWGSDCVQSDLKNAHYPDLTKDEFKEIYPNLDDNGRRRKIARIASFADVMMVSNYSMVEFVPSSMVAQKSIDLEKIKYVGVSKVEKVPLVVHAPTNQLIKGTKYILEAIENLKKKGYKFDFKLIEQKTNQEAQEIFKKADIIVDQLRLGDYGTLAVESMAMGKPVICWVTDYLFEKYFHDCPIVRANTKNIENQLEKLIKDSDLRQKLGEDGRVYVEKHHDSLKIAQELIDIYENIATKKVK